MKAHEIKESLLQDLTESLMIDRSKESDLICFMEQYLKYPKMRNKLLLELRNCMEDKPYKNPLELQYGYTTKDITLLETTLDNLEEEMKKPRNNGMKWGSLRKGILQIQQMNQRCEGKLLDEWRIKKLESYFCALAESEQIDPAVFLSLISKGW